MFLTSISSSARVSLRALPAVATSLLLLACAAPTPPAKPGVGLIAGAALNARSGTKVAGTVKFVQQDGYVDVTVHAQTLPRSQELGFHIHEKGDCNSADGSSAGGHFNPGGHAHGPQGAEKHAGDMPALKSDPYGYATTTFKMTGVTLTEGPNSIMGRAVIVHKDPDDYKTQPTGNSGARIACGVIGRP
jgi:Cu-Zn family superoxide dismutase